MYYNTRARFTETDYKFIIETLTAAEEDRTAIRQLTADPEMLSELLHHDKLFDRATSIPPIFLSISPHMFFYLFVYRALVSKNLANDDVVDYIAGICIEFRSSHNLWQFSSKDEKMVYSVDLLNMLGDVDKHQQYYLRRYIGNVTLFLTGFFPDYIFQRSKKKGAPPLEYYEKLGRTQFETAASDSLNYDIETAPVLNTLAERFVDIRSALNIYTDAYLHLNSKKHSLEIIERQVATLDEESFRQSLEL